MKNSRIRRAEALLEKTSKRSADGECVCRGGRYRGGVQEQATPLVAGVYVLSFFLAGLSEAELGGNLINLEA